MRRIRRTKAKTRRIDPEELAEALGAERVDSTTVGRGSNPAMLAAREELLRRLCSNSSHGGLPAGSGTIYTVNPTDVGPHRLLIATTWDGQQVESAEQVGVGLETAEGALVVTVDAPFHGDPAPPGEPGPTPGLWEYEVVEVFIAGDTQAECYLEVELSPHGHHLVLRVEGVRQPVAEGLPLDYAARIVPEGHRWSGVARVPLDWLPPPPHRVNAFALHGQGSARRYLAWRSLPGDEPDFHQPRRFPALDLKV